MLHAEDSAHRDVASALLATFFLVFPAGIPPPPPARPVQPSYQQMSRARPRKPPYLEHRCQRVCIHTRRSADVAASSLQGSPGVFPPAHGQRLYLKDNPAASRGPAPCWPLGTRGGKGPGPAFRPPSSPRNPSDPPASPQGLQLCPRGSCTLPAPAPPGQSACVYVFLMGEFINMRSLSRIHRRCLSVLPLRTSFVASSHTGNRRSWRGPGPRL